MKVAVPVAIALIVLPLVAVYGTKANWFAFVIGQLYTQDQLSLIQMSAFEQGVTEGQSESAAKYELGREEGYELGRQEGFTEGCQELFNLLNTDRVMDFWDYYNGLRYVIYETEDAC